MARINALHKAERSGKFQLLLACLTVYGIAYNGEALICFTENRQAAEEAASLLNENSVEPCHATEIVEDSFIR